MKAPGNGKFVDIFTANQKSVTSAPILPLAEESHHSVLMDENTFVRF